MAKLDLANVRNCLFVDVVYVTVARQLMVIGLLGNDSFQLDR